MEKQRMDAKTAARANLLQWTTSVLTHRKWTTERWCRLAETSPTNLSRFMKDPEAAPIPSAETIVKLARVAGSEPSFLADPTRLQPLIVRVPRFDGDLLTRWMARAHDVNQQRAMAVAHLQEGGEFVTTTYPPSDRAFAVEVDGQTMNAAGILPGDFVVVEPPDVLPTKNGDVVMVLIGGQVSAYRMQQYHLFPQSTEDHRPLPAADVEIVGVAVQMIRLFLNT